MYRAFDPLLLCRYSSQHTVHCTSTNFPSTTTDSIYLSINYLTSTMSLLTLRSSPSPRTPRERTYGRAEQYFDITALGAHSSGTQFLPSPITEEPTDNWSAEDEAAWDQRLAKGGSKKILTARKRMDIRWWLQNPNAPLPSGTKTEKRYQAYIKHDSALYEL
jgi:hypothetical protein